MSFNSNGVNLKGQFNLKNTDPIDGRYVITSKDEYEALIEKDSINSKPKYLYPGLTFTVTTNFTTDSGELIKAGRYLVRPDGNNIVKTSGAVTIETSVPAPNKGVVGDMAIVYTPASEGLTFTSSSTTATVTGIGTCTDINIVIPPSYNNKPVTTISNSFKDTANQVVSITIPSSVTSISYLSDNWPKLTNLNVNEHNTTYKSIDGNLYSKDGKTLIRYLAAKPEKTFIIPNSVTTISNSAFVGCTNLENITIPNSVTKIGNSAFMGCSKLTNVAIPDSVTSIDSQAFMNCSSLKSILLSNKLKTLSGSIFKNCIELVSVNIPDSVTSVASGVFYGCEKLENVTLGSGVTSIEANNVFTNCSSLNNIIVNENNCSYKSVDGNLYNKEGTVLIKYANGKTKSHFSIPSNVTEINTHAFRGNVNLKSLDIPGSIKTIGDPDNLYKQLFDKDNQLTSIFIADGVTSIGLSAFKGCSGLTSITIPDSVTSISEGAFEGCTSLESITIPFVGATKEGTSNTYFGYIFGASSSSSNKDYVPSSLKTVIIHEGTTNIAANAFKSCSNLTHVVIPKSVTSIGDSAFNGCYSLKSITIPFVGESDNATGYKSHFGYIFGHKQVSPGNGLIHYSSDIIHYQYFIPSSLESVIIRDSAKSVKENAFNKCESFIIYCEAESKPSGWASTWNPSKLTMIAAHSPHPYGEIGTEWWDISRTAGVDNVIASLYEDMSLSIKGHGKMKEWSLDEHAPWFNATEEEGNQVTYTCDVTKVFIGAGVADIGHYAFENCTGLTELAFEGCSGLTDISSYAFLGCSSLTSVTIPDSVTTIGSHAFEDCSSLTSITIPDSVTSIGFSAFFNCSSLTSVTIGNSVTLIGSYAFKNCSSLVQVTIPDSVTSIGDYAFLGCSSLTSVTIGNSVTSIGSWAFEDCTSLASIIIPDSVIRVGSFAFKKCTQLQSMIMGVNVIYIGVRAFDYCSQLEKVKFKNDELRWFYQDESKTIRPVAKFYPSTLYDSAPEFYYFK